MYPLLPLSLSYTQQPHQIQHRSVVPIFNCPTLDPGVRKRLQPLFRPFLKLEEEGGVLPDAQQQQQAQPPLQQMGAPGFLPPQQPQPPSMQPQQPPQGMPPGIQQHPMQPTPLQQRPPPQQHSQQPFPPSPQQQHGPPKSQPNPGSTSPRQGEVTELHPPPPLVADMDVEEEAGTIDTLTPKGTHAGTLTIQFLFFSSLTHSRSHNIVQWRHNTRLPPHTTFRIAAHPNPST